MLPRHRGVHGARPREIVSRRLDAVEVGDRPRRIEPVHQHAEVMVQARLCRREALQLAAQRVRPVARPLCGSVGRRGRRNIHNGVHTSSEYEHTDNCVTPVNTPPGAAGAAARVGARGNAGILSVGSARLLVVAQTSKETERAELHKTIWRIANDLRGSVDGWDFKSYVLGMLFYRFISENLTAYLNEQERLAGEIDFDYARINDVVASVAREETVNEKGFFILPSQLFANVRAKARHGTD